MATLIVRPHVTLKDSDGNVINPFRYEFQAYVAAKNQAEGTYSIERPSTTITVT